MNISTNTNFCREQAQHIQNCNLFLTYLSEDRSQPLCEIHSNHIHLLHCNDFNHYIPCIIDVAPDMTMDMC